MDAPAIEWAGPDELDAGAAARACAASVGVEVWRSRLVELLDQILAGLMEALPLAAGEWPAYVTASYARAREALASAELTLRAHVERLALASTDEVYDVRVSTTLEGRSLATVAEHLCPCAVLEAKLVEQRKLLDAASRLLDKLEHADRRADRIRRQLDDANAEIDSAASEARTTPELEAVLAQIASWRAQLETKQREARRLWSEPPPLPTPCRVEHAHAGVWTEKVKSLAPLSASLRVRDRQIAAQLAREAQARVLAQRRARRRRWALQAAAMAALAVVTVVIATILIQRRERERERVEQLLARHDRIQIKVRDLRRPFFIGSGIERHLPAQLRGEIVRASTTSLGNRGQRETLLARLNDWVNRSDAQKVMMTEVMNATGRGVQSFLEVPPHGALEATLRPPPGYQVVGLTPHFRQVLLDTFGWVEVAVLDAQTRKPLPVTTPWIFVEKRRHCREGGTPIELVLTVYVGADDVVFGFEMAGPGLELRCE